MEAAFGTAFGRSPDAVGSAPGRVNLIGEHIDYNGGMVLPAALDKTVRVAMAPNETGKLTIRSTRFDGEVTRSIDHPAGGDWSDYAVGALALAGSRGWLPPGIDLLIESDVPDGAGVSSSAALITAILRAATAFSGTAVDAVDLAHLARSVENDYIGVPCGIMDQMAVNLLDHGRALALDTAQISFDIIDIPRDWSFLTLHSGVRRSLADGRYEQRFDECKQARTLLGIDDLCLLPPSQHDRIDALPPPLGPRVRHAISEHRRSRDAVTAMRAGDRSAFGMLMTLSHRSYAQDFEASTPEIDRLVADAKAAGAHGARLTGGGFGGAIVCLVDPGQEDDLVRALQARHPKIWRI